MTQSDDEIEFAFFVWPEYSIESIDNFIAGGEGVPIFPDVAEHLREIRHDAFQAFKAQNFDLMMAHLRALHFACLFYGARPSANMGKKTSRVQAKRRFDKPAENSYDESRNDKIRRFHARLNAAGETDATAQTAAEFGLTDRRIRDIVKQGRKQPG